MPITYNGTQIDKITFNGTEILCGGKYELVQGDFIGGGVGINITVPRNIAKGMLVWSCNKEGNSTSDLPSTTLTHGSGNLVELYNKFSTYSSSRGCLCVYRLENVTLGSTIRIVLGTQGATYRYAIIE